MGSIAMEALLVSRLPEGKAWRYEPKWDGFRCLAAKHDNTVSLRSKSGRPLGRYFPDIVSILEKLAAKRYVLDGELLVEGERGYSFSDLQLRLHPAASRVKMLAQKQPATFVIFDILETDKTENMMSAPFSARRRILDTFYKQYCSTDKAVKLSPQTDSLTEAMQWLSFSGWYIDGLVAKNSTAPYVPGERIMQKYKLIHTADCVVGGFRYGTDTKEVALFFSAFMMRRDVFTMSVLLLALQELKSHSSQRNSNNLFISRASLAMRRALPAGGRPIGRLNGSR